MTCHSPFVSLSVCKESGLFVNGMTQNSLFIKGLVCLQTVSVSITRAQMQAFDHIYLGNLSFGVKKLR